MTKPPATWCHVLESEFHALRGEPALDASAPTDPEARLHALHARLHERPASALCLSGGGIRSATFALGVLQGLAHAGVLGSLDYLSTVSGGGYIGGWLTAWLHREGANRRATVLDTIDPTHRDHTVECAGDLDDHVTPIDRVRQTCRYLAPRGGLVSADVWTLVTTMSRNLVLNWLVLLPLVAAALLVMRVYYDALQRVEQPLTNAAICLATGDVAWWSAMAAFAGFAISTGYVILNFVGYGASWSQQRFLAWFLLPSLAGAVAMTFFWSAYPCDISLRGAVLLAAAVPAVGWIALGAAARVVSSSPQADGAALRIRVGLRTVLAAMLAGGPIVGGGIWWLCSFQYGFGPGEQLRELYAVFGVPAVLGLGLAQMFVFVGIASGELEDAVLEWWSRCGAWLAIAAAVWMAAGILVFYMADLVELGVTAASTAMGRRPASATIGVLVPLLSSLAGIAARAGGQTGRPSVARALFQKIALPLVILVLLATVAWADLRGAEAVGGHPLLLALALAGAGLLVSAFVPVNRFSLHGMYRQRLIRTFLGASRRGRCPNAFTGFDQSDDLRVHELADVRPLHVINTTLNALRATQLGRHETLAQSFSFTPLYVGNRDLGYRETSQYGSAGGAQATGLSLGMALAVSGAAASPAMGMYSTKARAFLLTLANARLGLWFGNPRSATRWQSSEPPLSVEPLLRELLGLTTDHNPYVYLSDGGHYENLGLWEMVSRRCRFIIVADGGCDPDYTFDDLGNAVRRIRIDLGIPILFQSLDITKAGQAHGNPHAAVGRIRYSTVDGPDAPDGTILYIKATLSGDEPVDVRNFAATDPAFPHDSTADQFFDEARFESYRALGFHSVLSIAGGLPNLKNAEALCDAAASALAAMKEGRPAATT